jgi:heterodisulfide reductase subunit C
MTDFGFQINQGRTINLDIDRTPLIALEGAVRSFRRCVRCGSCTATCSASQFTDFNIRKIHTMFRSGIYTDLAETLKCCMLCGKCTLVCPRGINLRSLIINIRKILKENDL